MRSRPVNKYLSLLIVSCLLATAIAGPKQKPNELDRKQIQQQSKQNNGSQQEGDARTKRQVDFVLPDQAETLLEEEMDSDIIKKLGFDGSLLRVKRQGGGWRNHDWNRQDSSSDGSSSSDDSSTDTSDDSTDSSSDSDGDGDTDSSSGSSSGSSSDSSTDTSDDSTDSSSDSDSDGDTDSSSDSSSGSDDDDHHHHHHHHRHRQWRGGWGHGGWGRR